MNSPYMLSITDRFVSIFVPDSPNLFLYLLWILSFFPHFQKFISHVIHY